MKSLNHGAHDANGESISMAMSDIFISYARIDNEPFGEERARWVTEFAENLGKRLGMVAGDRADVWRDPRLRGNEAIWPAIEKALGEALALVSVVSPATSAPSRASEIALFVRKWQERGVPPDDARGKPLFKVVKTFVPGTSIPSLCATSTGTSSIRRTKRRDGSGSWISIPIPWCAGCIGRASTTWHRTSERF